MMCVLRSRSLYAPVRQRFQHLQRIALDYLACGEGHVTIPAIRPIRYTQAGHTTRHRPRMRKKIGLGHVLFIDLPYQWCDVFPQSVFY